ncbi:MAG: SRPBCC family protein [Acidimicrobiales bacterium]
MRRVVSGGFGLDLPAQEAIRLFTPEGERNWVTGWNPIYPAGEPSETPGTVFTTDHGGTETVWLVHMIDTDECTVAYSRLTPGHHAGTVRVSCDDNPRGGCTVSVTYDMSLLPGSNPTELDDYHDRSFKAMMRHWSEAIAQDL